MSLRRKVLACFKELHKARKVVFEGDDFALNAARLRINEEFRRNKDVDDHAEIEQLVKVGQEAAEYVRGYVVQAVYNPQKGVYQMKLRKDNHFEDNFPFLGGDNAPERRDERNFKNTCGGGEMKK